MEKRLMNIIEMSAYTSITKGTLYTMVCLKKIPPECVVHIGRALRFEKEAVDRWISQNRTA
jgi:excisionase family DNA binding protein